MNQITFYLDFISPYSYLAFEELPEALLGLSYAVDYKPVLFAGLLKHFGQKGPAEIAAKCGGPGLDSAEIDINLATTPAISG